MSPKGIERGSRDETRRISAASSHTHRRTQTSAGHRIPQRGTHRALDASIP
jgi:hypothetical protein